MIEFLHVKKTYTDPVTEVFQDFTEKVDKGEFVLITGESGSGKSTLISMILLETRPDEGNIYVAGQDILSIKKRNIYRYRRQIGVIFQDLRLVPEKNVYDNIMLARKAIQAPARESYKKVWGIAKMLGIAELLKRFPDELSGGEKQKACLARAMVNNPPILLADEPTSNLDPEAAAEIRMLLEILHSQGTTIILTTQDPILFECANSRRVELKPSIFKGDLQNEGT